MFALVPIELKHAVLKARAPTANYLLIAINAIVFLLGCSWPVGSGTGLATVLLYGFCHFSFCHLIMNLWALWVFGNPVNRRLGNGYYLLAYLGAVVAIGLICRLFCPGLAMGASGAIFAVMTIAMILLPAARLEVAYLAMFPLTLLIGLIVHPGRAWLYWFVRGGKFELRMYWCLLLIPVMLLAELIFGGLLLGVWGWGTAGHLFGVICGIAIVLMLPARITMPGRAAQGVL
jgi:membrane associated rhomboid family serine protease